MLAVQKNDLMLQMLMSELEKNSCRVTRTTLDMRDLFMHSIYDVLGNTNVLFCCCCWLHVFPSHGCFL